ncbi:MAG: 1,4-dihydroxy-2-naphthoate octaprenyltransferase [Prevotellaceae bacterium]|nr:1,4-dihydroxy-2-naphthoate octaprenyltransferase [Prevotellaceae bacterium]
MRTTTTIDTIIYPNGAKAWALAARSKTLSGAVAPVLVGVAWAWAEGGSLRWLPAVLCLLFALLMQVTANFVNDYVDFLGKRDQEGRLGPKRACSQGWITPRAMRWGIMLSTALSCLAGLPLVLWGGWAMIGVGVLCVVFCFLYSTTLSELGLGDVLVLVFFGLVPVCLTYYLQRGSVSSGVWLCSVAMGLATDALLLVNNYRDIEQDRTNGKRTLAVAMGARLTRWLYLLVGLLAAALSLWALLLLGKTWQAALLLVYLLLHLGNHSLMRRINAGAGLNRVLGLTGMEIFVFALTLSLAAII